MPIMTSSEQLKNERLRLGLTQAEASVLLEVSKSTVEKWESGAKTPLPVTFEGALARLKKHKPKAKS